MPTLCAPSQPHGRWLVPVFGTSLNRAVLQAILREQGVCLYWRALTPLVVLWGMLYQRLLGRGTLDDVVSALQAGAADGLDPADPHATPLSERLRSSSTSAYNQARQRLPTAVIRAVRARLTADGLGGVGAAEQTWQGLRVRVLDGTTFRLPPEGDLEGSYGRARGRSGTSHWVTVQAVVAFCWATWLVVGHAESPHAPSETTLVRAVLADEPPGALVLGDVGFGIYRTVQVLHHLGQHGVLRLDPRHVPALLGQPAGRARPRVPSGTEWAVAWAHRAGIACDPEVPCAAVPGRVLYWRLERAGFRPRDLYLFTTLTEADAYPLAALVALYADRWQVELRYRDLKTTLQMEAFDVRSTALFEKELEVGLLAYTLIRLALLAATPSLAKARRLAFAAGRRRLRASWWLDGSPRRLARRARRLRAGLATCPIRHARHKVAHEPRAVRRTPQVFPALKGSRQAARQANLVELGAISS